MVLNAPAFRAEWPSSEITKWQKEVPANKNQVDYSKVIFMSSFFWLLDTETGIIFFPTVFSGPTFFHGIKLAKHPCETVKAVVNMFYRMKRYKYWEDDKSSYFPQVASIGWALISKAPTEPLPGTFRICPSRACSKTVNRSTNSRYRDLTSCCPRQGLFT